MRSAVVPTGVAAGAAAHHGVSACEASPASTAESAGMTAASKSAGVRSTATPSMSTSATSATVLSKGWGAYGQ